jgi:hypothetical protein
LSVDGIAAARMLTPGAIRSGCHTHTKKKRHQNGC